MYLFMNIRMLVFIVNQETANLQAPVPEKKESHDRDNWSGMFVQGSNCSQCDLFMVTVGNVEGIT